MNGTAVRQPARPLGRGWYREYPPLRQVSLAGRVAADERRFRHRFNDRDSQHARGSFLLRQRLAVTQAGLVKQRRPELCGTTCWINQ